MSQVLNGPEKSSATEGQRSAVSTTPNGEGKAARSGMKWLIHLLRRTHLYLGLLLLPWVLLYGVTGFLFNHPTVWSDASLVEFDASDLAKTPLAELPSPAQVAEQVVAAINARGQGEYQLAASQLARYERGGLSATVRDSQGAPHTVMIDSEGAGGTIRQGLGRGGPGAERGPRAPFAVREGVTIEQSPADVLEQGLPQLLDNLGMAEAAVAEVRMAPLSFQMEGQGKLWQVNYNAQTGSISGQEVGAAAAGGELSARQFMLRLHMAHHYPATLNMRWVWAAVADVVSLVMVFWGASGIVMWWQLKRTRWIGCAILLVSLVAALWIGLGMHEILAANPGGR